MADLNPPSNTFGDAYYQSRYSWTAGRDRAWQAISRYLQRYIPKDGTVLDLGAGYCSFINHIHAGNKQALDIYPGYAQYAHSNVKTHVGTCTDLSQFEPRSFDVVFASNLLEHLTREATQDVLREAHRILKPGGRLIVLQPNYRYASRHYFDDQTHIQIFTHDSLSTLLTENGFHVDKIEARFLPFSFKSHWPTWSWLVSLYLNLPFHPFAQQMLIVAHSTG